MMSSYVAQRRLHLGGGVYANAGDIIQGIEHWPTFRAHIRLGWVRVWEDEESQASRLPDESPPVKRKGRRKKGG